MQCIERVKFRSSIHHFHKIQALLDVYVSNYLKYKVFLACFLNGNILFHEWKQVVSLRETKCF